MLTLTALTNALNLIALAASLWLGLYLTTRSRTSGTAWLAAGALWILSAYFFQGALSISYSGNDLAWTRLLILFLIPLWLHLTYLLLPPVARPRWMSYILIPLGYLISALLLLCGIFTNLLFLPGDSVSLTTMARAPGPLYVVILPLILIGAAFIVRNLWHLRQADRNPNLARRLQMLVAATACITAAGIYVFIGTYFQLPFPFAVSDLGFFIGIFLFGYAVARYNATLEGRPIERDFVYTLVVVGSLTLLYCLVVWVLYLLGRVSFFTLALTVVGTVLANSLFDRLRLTLDRVFYQRQFQALRSNLRVLAREAGAGQTLSQRLDAILSSTCRFLRIKRGFVAVRTDTEFIVQATFDSHPLQASFPYPTLAANEIIGLVLPARKNLPDMKLLVPLFADGAQIGAVVFGERENGTTYSEADMELLEDLGEQLAQVIHKVAVQEQNAQQLNTLVQEFRARERDLQLQVESLVTAPAVTPAPSTAWQEEEMVPLVEDVLRRLYDYPYLGEHALAKMRVVDSRLAKRNDGTPNTFLDRGKALSETVIDGVNELRPDTPPPKKNDVPPREWHLYLILHDSYVEGEPNRDTMSKLYISEGTFSRTRRRALRAVAKSIIEMEAHATAA